MFPCTGLYPIIMRILLRILKLQLIWLIVIRKRMLIMTIYFVNIMSIAFIIDFWPLYLFSTNLVHSFITYSTNYINHLFLINFYPCFSIPRIYLTFFLIFSFSLLLSITAFLKDPLFLSSTLSLYF